MKKLEDILVRLVAGLAIIFYKGLMQFKKTPITIIGTGFYSYILLTIPEVHIKNLLDHRGLFGFIFVHSVATIVIIGIACLGYHVESNK